MNHSVKYKRVVDLKRIFFPLKKLLYSYILVLKKYVFIQTYKLPILFGLLLLLVGDIFVTQKGSDIRFFGITFLFLITASFYQLSSKITFIVCLALLGLMYSAFLFSGASAFVEKTAVWIVLFMIVGIIQQWKE